MNMPVDAKKMIVQNARKQAFWADPMCGMPWALVHPAKSRRIFVVPILRILDYGSVKISSNDENENFSSN